jgi:hypothetical protein
MPAITAWTTCRRPCCRTLVRQLREEGLRAGRGGDRRARRRFHRGAAAAAARPAGDGRPDALRLPRGARRDADPRFSETRRGHPLSDEDTTLAEAIVREREAMLENVAGLGNRIDTSNLNPNALRAWILDFARSPSRRD